MLIIVVFFRCLCQNTLSLTAACAGGTDVISESTTFRGVGWSLRNEAFVLYLCIDSPNFRTAVWHLGWLVVGQSHQLVSQNLAHHSIEIYNMRRNA